MGLHSMLQSTQLLPERLVRVICRRCLKSEITCYCKRVRPFRSRLQFVLLQHPLEYRKSIGTARMTYHCVENSLLILGTDFNENPEVNQLIGNPENHCVVLYPGKDSYNISELRDLSRSGAESLFPEAKNR